MAKIRLTASNTGLPVDIDLADIKTFRAEEPTGLNCFGVYLPPDMLNTPIPKDDIFKPGAVHVVLKDTFIDRSGTRYAHSPHAESMLGPDHLLRAGARRVNKTVATLQTTDEITAAILRIEWAQRQGETVDVYDLHSQTQGRINQARQGIIDGLHMLGSRSVPVDDVFGRPAQGLDIIERARHLAPGQTV